MKDEELMTQGKFFFSGACVDADAGLQAMGLGWEWGRKWEWEWDGSEEIDRWTDNKLSRITSHGRSKGRKPFVVF